MRDVILGSEAVASGALTRGQLRWNYRPIFPDVHVPRDTVLKVRERTLGAWLWSGRRGVVTGRAAAALHGAQWVDDSAPIELIHPNCHPPRGIITRRERVGQDEVVEVHGIAVTTPQRTAFDLGRFLPRGAAVAHLDDLARAAALTPNDVLPLAIRYKGARGVRRFKTAIDFMDPGGESPKETWLRMLLIDAGFPRPQTQIPVLDDEGYPFAYLDMGWEHIMVAVEYDGNHHLADPIQYRKDIRRLEKIHRKGWIDVRVVKGDRAAEILNRVRAAWAYREAEARAVKRAC
ncbi:MAG TPA: hypothetical protein VFB19_19925 [Mycobacterium sp.]|nr:hypothetical protein [Mycobacterium sp.]